MPLPLQSEARNSEGGHRDGLSLLTGTAVSPALANVMCNDPERGATKYKLQNRTVGIYF